MLLPSGNPFKCHEEVLYFQLLIPPKRFDIFSPRLGDAQKVSEGLDAFMDTFCGTEVVAVVVVVRSLYNISVI